MLPTGSMATVLSEKSQAAEETPVKMARHSAQTQAKPQVDSPDCGVGECVFLKDNGYSKLLA